MTITTDSNKYCLLIISCDKYSSIWDGITENWKNKFLDKINIDAFVLTNNLEYSNNGFQSIRVGEDKSWSLNLKNALIFLKKNGYTQVITSFDDLFILNDVNHDAFLSALNFFNINKLTCLKLVRRPLRLLSTLTSKEYIMLKRGKLYTTTCVFTLWEVESLKDILDPNESAWEFERNSTHRIPSTMKVASVKNDIVKYFNSIIKGKLQLSSRYFEERYNFRVTGDFKKMTIKEFLLRRIKRLLHFIKTEIYAS